MRCGRFLVSNEFVWVSAFWACRERNSLDPRLDVVADIAAVDGFVFAFSAAERLGVVYKCDQEESE